MDRNERDRRRAAFGRPREALERARSLAHALELEDEAEREAAHGPRPPRRATGRFGAISVVAVFVTLSACLLALMVDRYRAQVFMRDHGVAAQAVITDKTYSAKPPRAYSRTYHLYFRFTPRSPGGPPAPAVEEFDAVPASQFAKVSVGQTVTIRYNPQRLSQSTIYLAPPPTDGQIIFGDLMLVGVWVILFGGLCALIVGVAWPERTSGAQRIPNAWASR